MGYLLVITLLFAGASIFYLVNKDETRLYVGAKASDILRRSIVASQVSNEDFDIKMLGVDILLIHRKIEGLTDKDKKELISLGEKLDYLNGVMDAKLNELGILEEVENGWRKLNKKIGNELLEKLQEK